MEHVEGSTLAALLANGLGLPLDDACRYAAQVIHAVAYAHVCGIVHGDLKSSNIMTARDRRAKILDFGLAVRLTNGGRERQRVDALAGDPVGSRHRPVRISNEPPPWRHIQFRRSDCRSN